MGNLRLASVGRSRMREHACRKQRTLEVEPETERASGALTSTARSDNLLDRREKVRLAKRLGQVVVCANDLRSGGPGTTPLNAAKLTHASLQTLLPVTEHGVRGERDDRQSLEPVVLLELADDLRRLLAAHERHGQVHEHDLSVPGYQRLPEPIG